MARVLYSKKAKKIWLFLAFLLSGRQDSNLRPPVPKTGALPDCATPRWCFTKGLTESKLSRGDRIRTCDHLFPKQARYRTALHPAHSSLRHLLSIALSIISELRVQRYYIFSIPPNFSLIFFKKICILMQNGWDTDKNKGNPYLELPLYLIIYSSG